MSITKDALLQTLAVLFPPTCLACGRIEGIKSLPLGLCSHCRVQLETLEASGTPALLGPSSLMDDWISRWSYEPPFTAVIHGLKFGRLEYLGRDLADGLQSSIKEAKKEIDLVVPVPLHWHRRLTRGYNQAEAIARPLARRLGLPWIKALRRNRSTRPQARLTRAQRETNLRLAFALLPRQCGRIVDRRLLLVDDVVTTGATLEAAARCLKEGGAYSVTALTAARTPPSRGQQLLDGFDKDLWNSV